MNYLKQYNNLIASRLGQTLTDYKEVHHIVPKCIGGSNDKTNLIELTAREHFIAHMLLAKIHYTNSSLLYAFNMMLNTREHVTNRKYEQLRMNVNTALSKDFKGKMHIGKKWSYCPITMDATFTLEIPRGNMPGRPAKDVTKQKFSNNTSGTSGVFYRKDTNRWRATIKLNNKTTSLGCFLNKEDAITARKAAELAKVSSIN